MKWVSKKFWVSTDMTHYRFFHTDNPNNYFDRDKVLGLGIRASLPKLKVNKLYQIHIQQDPKGNFWLKKYGMDVAYKRNKKMIDYCCNRAFFSLFCIDLYNEIPTVWTRYKVEFKPV